MIPAVLPRIWHWLALAALALIALLFLTLWQREKAHSADLDARHAAQIADYQAAYSTAVATASAQKAAKEKQYEEAREKGDASYAALSDRYRAAVLRYQIAQAHPGSAIGGDLPIGAQGSGLPEEATQGAGILVSPDDATLIADLAAYAEAAHLWATGLEP